MLKKIKNLLRRREQILKVNDLSIDLSGFDKEGDAFVQLSSGVTFYGKSMPRKYDRIFYWELSSSIKKSLQFEALQVAVDIVIRYKEGGLQYGGPKKQSRYTVKNGDIVSEMGAYQGFCSVKLAEQVGEKGKVIAIEPMPDNFRLLEKNIRLNKLDNVICINKAVWDQKKEMRFNRRINDGQSSSIEMDYENQDTFSVQADTLDNIYLEVDFLPEDFMIIQLNGAEINGLRGLKSFHPKNLSIAARYDTEGVDAAIAVKELLESRGYTTEIDESDFVFAKFK